MAKKKTKKQIKKRKTAKRKTAKRKPVVIIRPPLYHLHIKKAQIRANVPLMPCTVIAKTRQGFVFAHTQASEVYDIYRQQCEQYRLVINRIEGSFSEGKSPELVRDESGWQVVNRPCIFYHGTWKITDIDSGESETFMGAGAGDNNIWSIMSAQTNAKKQALLDYFETCWPQPTSLLEVTKEYLQKIDTREEYRKAVTALLPGPLADSSAIVAEINKYFSEQFSKGAKS